MPVFAYYPGCSLKQTSAFYDKQVKYVCHTLDMQLEEIEDWNCCGATSAGKIDNYMSLLMPARNIAIAESKGYGEIAVPCSACYSRTITTLTYLRQDKNLLEQISSDLNYQIQGNITISNLLELLWKPACNGKLKSKLQASFNGLTVVCYYGCMLNRFPADVDIFDDPENPQTMEKILNILGCHTPDWNSKTACCGASAAVNDQAVAYKLMSAIFKEAFMRGAECIVTTCPMCQMNLDLYQKNMQEHSSSERSLPIFYLTELIGWALDFPEKDLQLEKHFVQGTETLKESLEYVRQ